MSTSLLIGQSFLLVCSRFDNFLMPSASTEPHFMTTSLLIGHFFGLNKNSYSHLIIFLNRKPCKSDHPTTSLRPIGGSLYIKICLDHVDSEAWMRYMYKRLQPTSEFCIRIKVLSNDLCTELTRTQQNLCDSDSPLNTPRVRRQLFNSKTSLTISLLEGTATKQLL